MRHLAAIAPLAGLALALALGACAPRARPHPHGRSGDPAGAIADADRAMGDAVAARDEAAFRAHLEPGAAFGGAGLWAEGPDEIVRAWRRFLAPGGPRLAWAPDVAWVSASGDLGYSLGAATVAGPEGAVTWRGRYATLWRRGADGRFRVLLDLGDEPAPEGGPLAREPGRTYVSRAGDLEARGGRLVRGGAPAGVWMTVRVREAGVWRTAVDAAVPAR